MAENIYKCPKCSATLKPGRPVPAGKKIKCPKCETIFAPGGETKESKPAPAGTAKPAAGKPKIDDEDDLSAYALKEEPPPPEEEAIQEEDDDEDDGKGKKKKKKKEEEKDLLGRRFPKSKKGAAQALCQKPTNKMLATSSTLCLCCIVTVVVVLWPLFFSEKKSTEVKVFESPWSVWLMVVVSAVAFVYYGLVAVAAVKMQSIESYAWSWIGIVLMILPFGWGLNIFALGWFLIFIQMLAGTSLVLATVFLVAIWNLYLGVWNLATLRKELVYEAFHEKRENF